MFRLQVITAQLICKKKTIEYKNVNITINTLRTYLTLYHTYFLLNCRGHIQMISNYSAIDV